MSAHVLGWGLIVLVFGWLCDLVVEVVRIGDGTQTSAQGADEFRRFVGGWLILVALVDLPLAAAAWLLGAG